MSIKEPIQLKAIARDYFEKNARYRSTNFQVYSSALDLKLLIEEFLSKIKPTSQSESEHPLKFLVGAFDDFELNFSTKFQYVDQNRNLIFFNKPDKIRLPKCNLILFASPSVHDDNNTSEEEARKAIAVFKTILTGFCGRALFLDLITEFSIDGAGEQKNSFSGKWIRVPQSLDSRVLADANLYDEILDRLPLQTDPLRSRITTACRFFNNALLESQEYKRFFDYWTALEILCGKSQAIKSDIAKAYGCSFSYVDDNLKFKVVADLRHDLIHNGRFHRLEPDVERRIQALFLDILRGKIGLSCSRVTEKLGA